MTSLTSLAQLGLVRTPGLLVDIHRSRLTDPVPELDSICNSFGIRGVQLRLAYPSTLSTSLVVDSSVVLVVAELANRDSNALALPADDTTLRVAARE